MLLFVKFIFLLFAFANAKPHQRIVGGTQASDTDGAFAVSVHASAVVVTQFCGASLVSQTAVLTAAHCIDSATNQITGSLLTSIVAQVGTNNLLTPGSRYSIVGSVTHPDWNSATAKNDLGLFVLGESVALGANVAIIPLHADYIEGGIAAVTLGWGLTTTGGSVSHQLRRLDTTALTPEDCQILRSLAMQHHNTLLPAVDDTLEICSYHSLDNGNCQGDGGNALYIEDETNGPQQIGITSWTLPCALGAPDVNTRISQYVDWIQENL